MANLKPLEAVPQNILPFWVGEKIAFPDIIESPAALSDAERVGAVEARHPKHRFAGTYGIIQAVGVEGGVVKMDVIVIDPFTGEPVNDTIQRVTTEEIQ